MKSHHVVLVFAMLVMDSWTAFARQAAPPPQATAIEGSVPDAYKAVGGTELGSTSSHRLRPPGNLRLL